MRRAALQNIGSLPSFRLGKETYDPDKLGLGPMMVQKTGAGADDKFCGPVPISLLRTMEASTAIPFSYPWAMKWSDSATSQWDWVFFADIATAAATRRIGMMRYDRLTGTPTYDGFLTVTFPGTSEAKTIRALRMTYTKHTAGTVSVSGTAVTGSGTTAKTDGACVGNRIGFGSTDPAEITQWYELSALTSDTGWTLTTSAGTISSGTPYVIEDLRAILVVTSVTTSLGGLYVVKGLRRELFSSGGGAVPAATTTDNIRACYFLKDAATGTCLVAFGASLENAVDFQTQFIWILETLANPVLFKFNVRGALTLTAGADTSRFQFKTGAGGAVTGTTSQLNNGRLANTSHGPGNGLNCIYFTTMSRIYRTADVSLITTGSTTWLIDNMTEVPPGGVNTFALGAGMQAIEYSDSLDRFIVTSSGAAGIRSYITQYRTDGGQMDRIIFADFKQIDQGSADSSTTPFPSQLATVFSVWVEGGMMYAARNGTTTILNQIYAVPLGVDWEYAGNTGCRIIFPRIACADIDKFIAAFSQEVRVIGGASGKNLGMSPQPFRLYYRTGGISDNSGGWNLIPWNGDLSGVAGASHIQFMAEFRIDNTMIPARIQTIGAVYDDLGMSDYWQGSSNIGTSLAAKQFGFRHRLAYGTTVPRLKVELFDAESGSSLGSDDSTTQAWTWEKSTNAGGAWGAYNSTDRANADTYVRVTPTSLADNIKVRAVMREY